MTSRSSAERILERLPQTFEEAKEMFPSPWHPGERDMFIRALHRQRGLQSVPRRLGWYVTHYDLRAVFLKEEEAGSSVDLIELPAGFTEPSQTQGGATQTLAERPARMTRAEQLPPTRLSQEQGEQLNG